MVSDSSPHEGGESKGLTTLSYTEVFYKHLPYYLAIGMPYDIYWNGDCRATECYRKAEEIKQRQKNQELWLQGMYIYEALCDVSPILQAFAKKGTKPVPYSSEPYAITKQMVNDKRKRQEQLNYEKTKAKISAWMVKTNMQMEARNGKEVNGG